ncbi:MAG: TorF family putative porin [Planctomycetota bacterium]
MTIRTRSTLLGAALAAVAVPALPALAQEGPNTGSLSFSGSATVTTDYFFRGILQEDQGLIIQPEGTVTADLIESDDYSLSGYFSIWNSLHEEGTGSAGANDQVFETDFIAGLSASAFEDWTFDVYYVWYTFPNNAFATVEEINFMVSFDDSEVWGDSVYEGFALAPYVNIAFEVENTAFGTDEGIYVELGVAPEYVVVEDGDYPVTLSVPVVVGLSLDDYYDTGAAGSDDDEFGFLSVGVGASVPLPFIPSSYGSWTGYANIDLLILGDNLEAANNGDDFEVIGSGGVALDY